MRCRMHHTDDSHQRLRPVGTRCESFSKAGVGYTACVGPPCMLTPLAETRLDQALLKLR